jgi:hypothetical protein
VTTTAVSSRAGDRLAAVRSALRSRHAPLALLGALMLLALVLLYRKGSGLTFFYDEWNFVMNRRDWSVGTFLEPHNEHLSLVPVAIYKLLFATVGIDAYWPYRVLLLTLHLVCIGLLFVLARRRVGGVVAVYASLPVLFLGAAWQDLLWAFQIGYLVSVAAGLGMLLALERRSRGADALACILLAVAVASSTIGIPFAVAAFVELVARREPWQRLWIVAAPVLLYALWSLAYGNPRAAPGAQGGVGPLLRQNIPDTPLYVANAAAGAFGAVTGLGLDWGRPLALLAAVGLAVWLASSRPVTPRALGLLGAALAYWGLTGLFRAQLNVPAESRYLYFGAVLLVLLAVELFRAARLSDRARTVLVVLVAAAAVANFGPLQDGSRDLQDTSGHVTAGLGALEAAGESTDPGYRPDPVRAPDIVASRYFAAVRDLGSPAATVDEIRGRAEPYRQTADLVLVQALPVSLLPGWERAPTGNRPPTVDGAPAGRVSTRQGCTTFRPAAPGSAIDLTVPRSGLVITPETPADVRVRQFASDFPPNALGSVAAGTTTRLRIPERPQLGAWHARLTPTGPLTVCTLR